jgi:hypothetical protein
VRVQNKDNFNNQMIYFYARKNVRNSPIEMVPVKGSRLPSKCQPPPSMLAALQVSAQHAGWLQQAACCHSQSLPAALYAQSDKNRSANRSSLSLQLGV